jgi:hypothetical protein
MRICDRDISAFVVPLCQLCNYSDFCVSVHGKAAYMIVVKCLLYVHSDILCQSKYDIFWVWHAFFSGSLCNYLNRRIIWHRFC